MAKKILLAIALLLVLAAIWPFVKRPERQSNVANPIVVQDVEAYLSENLFKPNFGGKLFCAHKTFGQTDTEQYVWALCEEYYLENGSVQSGTGESLPVVLKLSEDGKIIGHVTPGDGSLYGEDIRKLFPANLHEEIFSFSASNANIGLGTEIEGKVRAYFDQEVLSR